MSTFLNRLSQSAATRVEVDSAFAGTPIYHDGLVYGTLDKLVVNYAGIPVYYMAGIGFTATGEMCVVDASAGLPADTTHHSGLPISRAQSRLCVDATGAVSYWHSGVPFTVVRAVAVTGSGGGGGQTLDELRVVPAGNNEPGSTYVANLYFGSSGTGSGQFTNKATFLAAHPSLTLQDFSGIAAANSQAALPASFTGFTTSVAVATGTVVDSGFIPTLYTAIRISFSTGTGSEYLRLLFSPAIQTIGAEFAGIGALLSFRSLGVELAQMSSPNSSSMTFNFRGYSTT